MIVYPFISQFYSIIPAPNADEIIKTIDKFHNKSDYHDGNLWGDLCNLDNILLKSEDFIELYKPSIDLLSEELNKRFNYTLYNPWLNLYQRGNYQEVHNHKGYDIASVFFYNDGADFSKFFFMDTNSCNFSINYDKIMSDLIHFL